MRSGARRNTRSTQGTHPRTPPTTPSARKGTQSRRPARTPGPNMAAARGLPESSSSPHSAGGPTSPSSPGSAVSTNTEDLLTEAGLLHNPVSSPAQVQLLQHILAEAMKALPTKADIAAMIDRMEERHRAEVQSVKEELSAVSSTLQSVQQGQATSDQRIDMLEQQQRIQNDTILHMQLHIEDLEDRSRRNNLRLRGLPEATGREDLTPTTEAIFRKVLGPDYTDQIVLDRVHRALGPKSNDPARPRDVVCRVHHYSCKEAITRAAWAQGPVDFDGARVQILPDLSRATLQRRAILRPLLESLRSHNCTYRWGFPFQLHIRRGSLSFTLKSTTELPSLFTSLEIPPLEVPNWMALIPSREPGMQGRGPDPARRGRSRPRRQRRAVSVSGRAQEVET